MSGPFEGDDDVLIGSSDEAAGQPAPEIADDDSPEDGAPRYPIPLRYLAAVEIPAVVENIDRAVKAFGRTPSLTHALDPARSSLPFYLNPESPFCPPIMSHNARSHNLVLKVTVPKRTGRKRKRGADGPWQGDIEIGDADATAFTSSSSHSPSEGKVCSIARLDDPKVLRRKLADNVDKYQVEAVGTIKHTHRFRGLADFYWDMSKSSFAQRYTHQVLPGDVQQMKNFKFIPGTDAGPNVDIIPPPLFTHMSLPFNYNYSQNPYVRTTEDGDTINTTAVRQVGYFIGAEDPAPAGPQFPPDATDPRTMEIIAELEEAFQDRPVWTRRSLLNHLGGKLRNWNELKKYLNYAAYQFKGGPWRDGVVPYGLDPRTDPRYRIYQTLMFKLSKRKFAHQEQTWASLRRSQASLNRDYAVDKSQSHTFDGESYHTDGKVWQVCDITDPLLKELLDNAAVRPTWDVNSGWYHGGLWAKVKAIMKTKLVAIRFGRHLTRTDFAQTLDCGDRTPTKPASSTFHLPLPRLDLTNEELTVLRGREPPKKKSSGYNARVRDPGKSPSVISEQPPSVYTQDGAAAEEERMGSEDEDMASGSGGEDDEDEDEEAYPGHEAYGRHHEHEGDDAHGSYGEDGDVAAMSSVVYPELD
ncbi:Transcription factor tau subunit sfc1 [Tolypocladium paradoxum]|uniref:Transcription factor tau subunit sfc1 n=1 Tax=Tolypocladium paradoxum TaxID=94208 RepID=A0A2S4KLI8_9HYPO|nr:Transcription factor tau subunit sfc1 [Tolypocladium paradoxum]